MANEVESVRQLTSEIEGCISDAEGELLYRLAKYFANIFANESFSMN